MEINKILLLLCMLTNPKTCTAQESLKPYGLIPPPWPDLQYLSNEEQREKFINSIKYIKKTYTPEAFATFIDHCIAESLAPWNDEKDKKIGSYGLCSFSGIVSANVKSDTDNVIDEIKHRHLLFEASGMECLIDNGVIKKGKLPPDQEALKELYLFTTDRTAYHAYRHKKSHKRCTIS